jgi:ABC-type uncharacterized transport system YnjBCD permease subunit
MARAYGQGLWQERHVLGYTLLVSLTLFIVAPFGMIALRSVGKGWFGRRWLPPELTLEWYRWAVDVGNIPEVLKNTLIIGVVAVLLSTVIGIAAGWAFGRRRVPGKELVLALLLLPQMIPSITYALGVAKTFYALRLVDTHLGVALAHVSVCAPYAIMVLSATFERLDERVLEAASVCGAGAVRSGVHDLHLHPLLQRVHADPADLRAAHGHAARAHLPGGRRRLLGDHQRDGGADGDPVARHPGDHPAARPAREAGRRLQGRVEPLWPTP